MTGSKSVSTTAQFSDNLSPRDYEMAVLERFRTLFPSPGFVVAHDARMLGERSRVMRQIDIAVFEPNTERPILIVEAKRHHRPIDLVSSGATVSLVRDVGGPPAVMVSTNGFSRGAESLLLWEGIHHLTISVADARGLRLIPLIEHRFCLDRYFREFSGELLEALRTRKIAAFLEVDIPYEEWIAVIGTGLALFPECAIAVLRHLAPHHADDGVRFNAARILIDCNQLHPEIAVTWVAYETDPEVRELLCNFVTSSR